MIIAIMPIIGLILVVLGALIVVTSFDCSGFGLLLIFIGILIVINPIGILHDLINAKYVLW